MRTPNMFILLCLGVALVTGCNNGLCTNTCITAHDGVCDDGASYCALGTDCGDCGPRVINGGGGGVPVPELGGAIAEGATVAPSSSLQPATSTGRENTITGGRIYYVDGGDRMAIELNYTGVAVPEQVLIDTGDTVLAFPVAPAGPTAGEISEQACQIAESMGYPCTQACREACNCIQCDSSTIEAAIEGGCAVACSRAAADGTIGGPAFSSEADLADKTYNGYMSNPGLISSGGYDCSGSVCAAAAREEEMQQATVFFGMVGVDYGPALNHLTANSRAQMTSPPSTPSGVGIRSTPFPTGMLNTSTACPPAVVCGG